MEIAKPGCMDGASAAYFQSDQFWAVDSGLPDLFNQISLLVLFQAVSFFITVLKQMVSSTRHTMWLLVFQVGVEIGVCGRGGGGGGERDVWLVAMKICIRQEWHDATFYCLQCYVMSGIVAPEV